MYKDQVFLLILFLFGNLSVKGQKLNHRFIKRYPHSINSKVYIGAKTNEFKIEDNVAKDALNYKVAPAPRLGLGIAYRWFSLSGSLIKLNNSEEIKKGTTNQLDFQWNFYLRSITADLRVQKYQGYFLKNSKTISNWEETNTKLYQRDDLITSSFGGTVRYNFNYRKYSTRAIFSQTERQLKSAGSFSLGIRWNILNVISDSSIIPSKLINNFEDFELNQLSFEDIGIGAGYGYTFVSGKWFLNIGAMGFIVNQNIQLTGGSEVDSERKNQLNFQTFSAIGYANDNNYIGFTIVADQMYSNWKNDKDFIYTFSKTRFVLAKRFHIKPIVKENEIWF